MSRIEFDIAVARICEDIAFWEAEVARNGSYVGLMREFLQETRDELADLLRIMGLDR